uniref:Cytochrome P450 n=1 Tax=Cannabis sativa TaxID=3483 RepID=A0A803Q7X4_CANSA
MFLYIIQIFFFIYAIVCHLYNKILNFPPTLFPTLPIIGHIYLLKNPSCLHRTLTKLSKLYGPIFHLNFGNYPVLVISSPSIIEECLKQKDVIFANRPLGTTSGKIIAYNYTTLATSPYNGHWRNLRRISHEILTTNRLNAFSYVRVDEVSLLVFQLLRLGEQQDKTHALNMRLLFKEVHTHINPTKKLRVGHPTRATHAPRVDRDAKGNRLSSSLDTAESDGIEVESSRGGGEIGRRRIAGR